MRSHRYVEMAYDEGERECLFMAVLVETETPDAAVVEARDMVRRKHPKATNIEEFMQRTITPEKAAKIRRSFGDRSWEGLS